MFASSKRKLSSGKKKYYYRTLKELHHTAHFKYYGSVLVNDKFRVLEKHYGKLQLKKDLDKSIVAMLKRFKKFEGKELPLGDELFPFERLLISMDNVFLAMFLSEHYGLALYFGKENLNMGTILNIIFPKMGGLLEYLEKEEN